VDGQKVLNDIVIAHRLLTGTVRVVVSSLSKEDVERSIKAAGFAIENEEVARYKPKGRDAELCSDDEAWEETHLFVYARKPE
jgi:uncharacterized protein (UPF0261 family)